MQRCPAAGAFPLYMEVAPRWGPSLARGVTSVSSSGQGHSLEKQVPATWNEALTKKQKIWVLILRLPDSDFFAGAIKC